MSARFKISAVTSVFALALLVGSPAANAASRQYSVTPANSSTTYSHTYVETQPAPRVSQDYSTVTLRNQRQTLQPSAPSPGLSSKSVAGSGRIGDVRVSPLLKLQRDSLTQPDFTKPVPAEQAQIHPDDTKAMTQPVDTDHDPAPPSEQVPAEQREDFWPEERSTAPDSDTEE